MSNFDDLTNELNDLTQEMRRLTKLMGQSSASRHIRSQERFWKMFDKFMNTPIMKEGKQAFGQLGEAMSEMNQLSLRSLATNKTLISTINKDLIFATFSTGLSMSQLAGEVISLREEGFMKVDQSLLTLAGRMKLTGQNTQSLIKFLGANTSVMMLNQREAANLAKDIAHYSQIYGTRQDDMLNLATSIAGNFAGQAQLGYGGQMTQAFTNLASVLGGRGTSLVGQLASFYQNATISQKQLLGFLNGFEERIATERDPEALKTILVDSLTKANQNIQSVVGSLGPGGMSTEIQKQLLTAFGGESALIIPQLLKALEDAKEPMVSMAKAIAGFNSAVEMFKLPMMVVGTALNYLINTPVIGNLVKGLFLVGGFVSTFLIANKILQISTTKWGVFVRLFNLGVRKFEVAVTRNLRTTMAGTPLALGIGLLVALLGEFIPNMLGMSDDLDDINKKTPDPTDKNKVSAGLTGQIFSQLVNIVRDQGNGSMQAESLAVQKQLLMYARSQHDLTKGTTSLPTVAGRSNTP